LEDGADDEPSLGSHEIREAGAVSYVARVVNAYESYQDCELDDCDLEDGDPEEESQQPAEMGRCGMIENVKSRLSVIC
jgi:hypothetical protein